MLMDQVCQPKDIKQQKLEGFVRGYNSELYEQLVTQEVVEK